MNAIPRQYRPAAEYQPGYDGLPVDGKQLPPNTRPCESRGERRSPSSGRRIVAASVLVTSVRASDKVYQPGYDGLPAGGSTAAVQSCVRSEANGAAIRVGDAS